MTACHYIVKFRITDGDKHVEKYAKSLDKYLSMQKCICITRHCGHVHGIVV
jgi:hypothetical protein